MTMSVISTTPDDSHSGNIRGTYYDSGTDQLFVLHNPGDDDNTRISRFSCGPLTFIDSIDLPLFNLYGARCFASDGTYLYIGGNNALAYAMVARVLISTFTYTSTLTLDSSETRALGMTIDGTNMYVYTENNPGKIVKVNLSTFTRTSAITMNSGERPKTGVVASGFLYTQGNINPSDLVRVTKIDLSSFTRTAGITLNTNEAVWEASGAIFADATYLYVVCGLYSGSHGYVVRVTLSTFTRNDALTLTNDKLNNTSYAGDPAVVIGTDLYVVTENSLLEIDLTGFTITTDSPHGCFITDGPQLSTDGTTFWTNEYETDNSFDILEFSVSTLDRDNSVHMSAGNVYPIDSIIEGSYIYQITGIKSINNINMQADLRIVKRAVGDYTLIDSIGLTTDASLGRLVGLASDGTDIFVLGYDENEGGSLIWRINISSFTLTETSDVIEETPSDIAYGDGKLIMLSRSYISDIDPVTLTVDSQVALDGDLSTGIWGSRLEANDNGVVAVIAHTWPSLSTTFATYDPSDLSEILAPYVVNFGMRLAGAAINDTYLFMATIDPGAANAVTVFKFDLADGSEDDFTGVVGAAYEAAFTLVGNYVVLATDAGGPTFYKWPTTSFASAETVDYSPGSADYLWITNLGVESSVMVTGEIAGQPQHVKIALVEPIVQNLSPVVMGFDVPSVTLTNVFQLPPVVGHLTVAPVVATMQITLEPVLMRFVADAERLIGTLALSPTVMRWRVPAQGVGSVRLVVPTARGRWWTVSTTQPIIAEEGYIWIDPTIPATPRIYQYVGGGWQDAVAGLEEAATRVSWDSGGSSASANLATIVNLTGLNIPADEHLMIEATFANTGGVDATALGIEINNITVMSGVAAPGTTTGEYGIWRIIIPRRDVAASLQGRSYILVPGQSQVVTTLASVPINTPITSIELLADPNSTVNFEIRNVVVNSLQT